MPEKNNQTIDELRKGNLKELAAAQKKADIIRARIAELEAQEQALASKNHVCWIRPSVLLCW